MAHIEDVDFLTKYIKLLERENEWKRAIINAGTHDQPDVGGDLIAVEDDGEDDEEGRIGFR